MIINPICFEKKIDTVHLTGTGRGISEASVIDNKEPSDWFVNQDTLEVLSTD